MLGGGTEDSLIVDITFWIIAISSIVAAVAVVQLRDVFRASLFLIVSFLGVAGMFVLLRAEFLAVIQVVIYVGAISVLIIFAILLTRDVNEGSPSNSLRLPAGILSVLFGIAAIYVAVATNWQVIDAAINANQIGQAAQNGVVEVYSNTVPWIARLLIRDYVLAFEVAGLLLLAAIIGALALIKER